MASSWFPANLIHLITAAAIHDDDAASNKLPAALVSSGIFLIASALGLVISKTPGAVLVTWHGSAAACTYYAVLVGTAAFGAAEVVFGLCVVDLRRLRRRSLMMTAKVLLSVSLLPLALVLALWAGVKV